MSLEGKVGVVTGAAKGIGCAIADVLLQKGAKVCIADIDEAGENIATRFNEKYGKGKAMFVKCDVTSNTDMESVIRGTKIAMDRMSKEKGGNGGVIINMASLYGTIGNELLAIYSASKHGVIGLTRSLGMAKDANEKNGIKLVALCPSFVDTDLVANELNQRPVEQRTYFRDIIEKSEGFMSTVEVAAAAMTLLDDDVESGSALIVGKARGQYFHKFDDQWKVFPMKE